jgi:peptidoglycan/xylan/chitin deacetylase (PgdA/CDA1 family)
MKALKTFFLSVLVSMLLLLPLSSVRTSAVATNLILNPSVENVNATNANLPNNWQQDKWGTNTVSYSYDTTGAQNGSRSISVNMTARTSGDAKWTHKAVTVTPNTKYTFSDYYKSSVANEVVAEYLMNDNSYTYAGLLTPAAATIWTPTTVTFTTPANVKTLRMFHLINKVGKLTTDSFSLVQTDTVTPSPPTVNITAPAANATVKDTVTLSANATDAKSVAGVQFKIDGANVGAEDVAAPYDVSWNTTLATNANHTLTAIARNSDNLTTTSTPVVVTVNNATPPSNSPNVIPNADFETGTANAPQAWVKGNWGTNTAILSYPVTGRSGNAIRTEITSYTNGDAKWYFEPQVVTGAKDYAYTDYYRSNIASELVIQYTDQNNVTTYAYLGSAPASATWKQVAFPIKTPANVKTMTVFHLISKVGYLELDDASLIAQVDVPQTDVVPNNSVEQETIGDPSTPLHWIKSSWGTNSSTYQYMTDGHTGNRSVKVTMNNYTSGDAKWYFEPVTTLTPGKQYRFSTWYKTNTIPHAVAMFDLNDGTTKFFGLPDPQPNGTTSWQPYSDSFSVPINAKNVSVFFFLSNNGFVQTDDYSIVPYTPVGFNRPIVTLTFDDGEEDNVTTALPLLSQYGFKSTMCFATEHAEGNAINSANILKIRDAGHEICSHTVTHPFLTKMTTTQVDYELQHSKAFLENLIGKPVVDFASPYGDYNAAVNTEIMKYYQAHRTVDEGYNSKDNYNLYRLRDQNMLKGTTMAEYNTWLNTAKANNTWLILVYHRVANDPGDYDTSIADFKLQLQALKDSGMTIMPMDAAIKELNAQL